ncbi:MAG: ABC transporter permease, partial [Solirubrobacteraceae bacterium]|nr:ABC transporter permease [Solirubrobacteraceae bacterium]
MTGFIIKRLMAMVLVIFAVSVLVFTIFNVIPGGDPAVRMAGKNPTNVQIEAIRREWGFDDSLPVQYVTMMEKVLTGDLISYSSRENVVDRIVDGLPRTFALTAGAAFFMLLGGIALGTLSALKPHSTSDRLINGVAVIGISLPVMWLGGVVSYYGSQIGIVPNGGYVEISEGG